ncbi:MAG: TetR family transcriptional regulator [Verrucomicrobia bacterium]|nr:TetR family transcriptional regulator [Verrucomicrobiota bacterium]
MSNPLRQIEWRSLIEVAGPFLADAVLEKAFPQGLEKLETPRKQRVRSAYDEWCEAVEDSDPQLAELHGEWLRLVLEDLLEYDATVLKAKPEFPETIRYQHPQTESPVLPDMVVMAGEKPRLLIATFPPGTKLESPLADQSWLASPLERMTLLCRAAEVSLGLVTNGEQWTLVSAPVGETSSTASWFARIWQQEPITLQAFQSLLGVRRMFGPVNETLEALLLESLQHLDEVTDTLGSQVRRAVEVLVQALDRADLDRDRQLLKDVSPAQLYEAGLTVMMRLVFTLCAEERKLLLLGEPIYDQHYAISTLRARLNEDKEQLGEDVLERRHDAWSRLLAVFRAIYGGIEHETLRLPPLGGSIFDPDKYPFLEGRASATSWVDTPASPLPIDNRTVLLLLNALQVLEQRAGARLLSYLALDVEQIGHVYEGLLERTVKKVPETTLGLIGSQKAVNPNVLLRELEEAKAAGADRLLAYVIEQTQRSEAGGKKALSKPLDEALYHRVLLACGGDITLANRIKPFAVLLRSDNWGDPLVYRESAYMVTLGAGRRETGTHYTPKTLTEPIVQHTLEPLVYVGPAEGKTREEWQLKSPAELLALKVCDMAMGSGAFLVQTCRYLGDRLVEAWDAEEKAGLAISIEGDVLEQPGDRELLPRDKGERVLNARRLAASRCLYGVDINPMAVELAKLSLWLVTMMKGRPFNFLDHALKCGDSLLGVTSVQQIENFSLRPGHWQTTFATANLAKGVEEASVKRRALEDLPSNDHTQIETKNRLHSEAEAATAKVKALADALIAFELRGLDGDDYEDKRADEADKVQLLMERDADASLKSPISNLQSALATHAREQLRGRHPFHWVVEYPEVFARGGFDGFVGNPPFVGGKKITGIVGEDYRNWIVRNLAAAEKGAADLSAYFLLRAHALTSRVGFHGLIATNAIADGDTERVGLRQIVNSSGHICRAYTAIQWPGEAGVVVAVIWWNKAEWAGPHILDDVEVAGISSHLAPIRKSEADAYPLRASSCNSFAGTYVNGEGFILSDDEAERLLRVPKNRDIVLRYLIGDDINSRPNQLAARWVIDFKTMSREEAQKYDECFAILTERVKPYRDTLTKQIHEADYWKFWDKRNESYREIARFPRVLVAARASKYVQLSWVTNKQIFSDQVVVFITECDGVFACLQSTIHGDWAWERCTGMWGAGIRYAPSKAVTTFALPNIGEPLKVIGKRYFETRIQIEAERSESLTSVYNRFHDRGEQSEDIARLRALHEEMDQAVAAAYGWSDLDLGHGFHATKQGERYTLSESARRTVLDRLLALNHQRYEEEVKAGLHDKKAKGSNTKGKRGRKPQADSAISELF